MDFPLFIARRIYSDQGDRHKVSRPAIRIAMAGIAIGLAVMIVTVSVVLGFKHTIRDKVVGFGCHILVENVRSLDSPVPEPICIDDSLTRVVRAVPGVHHVQRYALAQGILKTDSDFTGVMLKGVGSDYDTTFLNSCIVAGKLPSFSSTESSYQLVISRLIADRLRLQVGDRIMAYFISYDNVRARKFTVAAIYASDMSQFDEAICFSDLPTAVRLNNWESDRCSGAELQVNDFSRLDETAALLATRINRHTDHYDETITSRTVYETYPQIFSWLSLLDMNVWIILILMVCVACFTMVSGLLIIILERTQTIGLLKALGARTATIRHTFLWFAVFIVGRGLLWGNILGLGLIVLQRQTGFITLDPTNYYVSEVPMELNIPLILALNAATLLVTIAVLVLPTLLVAHIHPARSMRYE